MDTLLTRRSSGIGDDDEEFIEKIKNVPTDGRWVLSIEV
jgi:hypothetical protein